EHRGVDPTQQRASYFCSFPRLPVKRSAGNGIQASSPSRPRASTSRNLPPYRPPDPHRRQNSAPSLRPRILPVIHANAISVVAPALSHRRQPTPPKSTTSTTDTSATRSRPSRTVFTSAAKARPLRLVEETLTRNRKRRAPVFYAQSSHSVVQSLTYITIHHHHRHPRPCQELSHSPSAAAPAPANMATTNPIMPKVAPPLPSLPGTAVRQSGTTGSGGGEVDKDRLLADLRRQLDDSASDVSSVDSRGGRRRRSRSRRNNNKQLAQTGTGTGGGLAGPTVLPRLAETKPVRLQLGLNLDVEVELKARLQGDVSLTLLVEEKPSARPSSSAELRPNARGAVDEYAELFYMRLGRFSLRRRWIDREVSPSLTAAVALLIALGGFVLGFVAAKVLDGSSLSFSYHAANIGIGTREGEAERKVAVPLPLPLAVSGPVSVLGCGLQGAAAAMRDDQSLYDDMKTETRGR
ncbi:hypothetical protein C8A03DRAFT_11431, partial [Achaetomium macrosporum]